MHKNGRIFYVFCNKIETLLKKTGEFLSKFSCKLGYKDSNLEMTESESVALPFGDSPSAKIIITISNLIVNRGFQNVRSVSFSLIQSHSVHAPTALIKNHSAGMVMRLIIVVSPMLDDTLSTSPL